MFRGAAARACAVAAGRKQHEANND
jgi:hypothetical protein